MKTDLHPSIRKTNTKRLFHTVALLSAIAMTAGFFISACDSGPGAVTATASEQARSNAEEAGQKDDTGMSAADLDEINTFEEGAFEDPDRCASCHQEIHAAWSESKHRFAWVDPFYQPNYLQASRETDGFTDVFCGECHAPIARRTGQLPPPDGSRFDETSKKGVSCDYCHTVKTVVEPVNVRTISDPGDVKRGPRGDGESPYHKVKFSETHTDPAFCGACHNVIHPTSGALIIDTYSEWKEGPYAEEGTRCQDCHMTPGPGVSKNPGKSSFMGEERDHVATHFFPGGSSFFQEREGNDAQAALAGKMLEAAAALETETTETEAGYNLLVRVKNVGAGHKIPTGVAYIRKMWLEVTATDNSGDVVYKSGHTTQGNHVDPDTVFYEKVFEDADGNLTQKSWIAEKIAYDRRIPPRGHDEQTFEIPVEGDGTYNVTVRLLYRSMSQEAAEDLDIEGIEVPSVEMAKTDVTLN